MGAAVEVQLERGGKPGVVVVFAIGRTVVSARECRPVAAHQFVIEPGFADEVDEGIKLRRRARDHRCDEFLGGGKPAHLAIIAHDLESPP